MESKVEIPNGNNFVIQIHTKSNECGAKKVIAKVDFSNLISQIAASFEEGNDIILKIVDKDNHKSKNVNIKSTLIGRESIEKIKQQLVNMNEVIEVPDEEKYRVVIDNCQSRKTDKKSLSIRFKGDIDNCRIVMEKFFTTLINDLEDNDIVFMDKKEDKATHNILIHKSGRVDDYKKYKSKSFSINLPNYSSEEIINIIRGKLK